MQDDNVNSSFTYRAFISYSHRDKAWADWLHKALETYRVPSRLVGTQTAAGIIPRRLNPIFRDRDELASAAELGRKVNEALARSGNLIVICSPASATSRWVNEEVLAYKRMGRAERIFCLIVGGEPNATDLPGRAAEECFCPALRHVDGQPDGALAEPIAADARPGKDGKGNARLKLIAGMLDVGFDRLKQREQQRHIRRLAIVAASALAVMTVTIVLAVFALISRHQAVIAQQAAERRQKQAEDLVGFMLGDLNDKLLQVNRLDIMQAVDDKAMAYFQSLPAADVSDTSLEQRAKALEKIGSVRQSQGQVQGALDAYQASAQISSRLVAGDPGNVDRRVAYSRTLAFIGMVHWNQDRLDQAQQDFETAREVLRHVQAHAKHDQSLLEQLELLSNNIGHVLEARGKLEAAEGEYRDNLSLTTRLVELDAKNVDYMTSLGDAHNNLGKMALLRGDLVAAVSEYLADDAIEARLSADDPKDNNQRGNVLRVRAIVGRTLALTGEVEAGMRDLKTAVAIADELVKFEPAEAGFREHSAIYSSQLARLQRLGGDLQAAWASTEHAVTTLTDLAREDPSNGDWQSGLAEALTEQAAESLASGKPDAARAQAQRAVEMLDPLLAKQPDDRGTFLATARAKLLLTDVIADAKSATMLREDVLRALQSQKSGPHDPRLLALQVETMLALGRAADAHPLIARLQAGGYRDPALLAVLKRARIDYPVNADFARRLAAVLQSRNSKGSPTLPPTHAAETDAASKQRGADDSH